MNGTVTVIGALLGAGLSGALGAWITGRWENKTEAVKAVIGEGALELDERRADGEAYERAQKISERIVSSLQVELQRLELTIEGLRTDLAGALRRNSELEVQNAQLTARNAQLEGHVRELERSAATMRDLLNQARAGHPSAPREEDR